MHLLSNHKDVFEKLFRENFRPLVVYAYQFVKSQEMAEDIVQEFFTHLYEKRDEMDFANIKNGYMYKSIHNRCLNSVQKLKVRADHINDVHNSMIQSNYDPQQLAEYVDFEHKVLQTLESLSPKVRKVFEMSRMEGKTNDEIAAELHLSKRTVETQISNALKVFRFRLKKFLMHEGIRV